MVSKVTPCIRWEQLMLQNKGEHHAQPPARVTLMLHVLAHLTSCPPNELHTSSTVFHKTVPVHVLINNLQPSSAKASTDVL